MENYYGDIIQGIGIVIGALIAAMVAIHGYEKSKEIEYTRVVEENLRKQKIMMYDEMATTLGELIFETGNNQISEEQFQKKMFILNHKALIWMGDKALAAYTKFRENQQEIASTQDYDITMKAKMSIVNYGNVLLEMRKDVGHSNIGINYNTIYNLIATPKRSF